MDLQDSKLEKIESKLRAQCYNLDIVKEIMKHNDQMMLQQIQTQCQIKESDMEALKVHILGGNFRQQQTSSKGEDKGSDDEDDDLSGQNNGSGYKSMESSGEDFVSEEDEDLRPKKKPKKIGGGDDLDDDDDDEEDEEESNSISDYGRKRVATGIY